MTVAQVVPLRRFPSDHQWFDYLVPENLILQPGHLVEVPFLRRQLPGVVWNLSDKSEIKHLKKINSILRSEPVMTDWQRRVCQVITEQTFVSLGHLLYSIVPRFPKRKNKHYDSVLKVTIPVVKPAEPPESFTWWYRSRLDALSWIIWWMKKAKNRARIIMVPTLEDGFEIYNLLQSHLPHVAFIHSKLNRTNYTSLYEGVRNGRIKHVVGTGRVLTLPYPIEPEIVIDQEEHASHKQTEQQPRTDFRRVLEVIKTDFHITTPAPSVRWWHHYHPPIPPVAGNSRQVVELDQVRKSPWLSGECEILIEKSQSTKNPLLLIAPQHGFASSISCRDCHFTADCQSCHQRLRLVKQLNEIFCRNCGWVQKLSATCPRCHGTRWATHGWGVEYIVTQLKQFWPSLAVSDNDKTVGGAEIIVDTYRGYRKARTVTNVSGIVIINGDALLNYPDFSVAERAWQFLARLQAESPKVPIVVQTFDPSGDFWQRWRRGDDLAWYESEITARQKHSLPPITDQWIASYPGNGATDIMSKKIGEILKLNLPNVSAVILPGSQRKIINRMLVTSTGTTLDKVLPGQSLFPYPWQVDTTVSSWL